VKNEACILCYDSNDVYSYDISINGLCKNKKVDEAMNIFQGMHRKNIICDTITYNSLIDVLCKTSGMSSYVWDLINEMYDKGQADERAYNS